ncbi:MAG: hypothetical protein H7Z41_17740 [Cytophagales bacterium]|nr:hypothetical protein [Armatimonadota bacterium]
MQRSDCWPRTNWRLAVACGAFCLVNGCGGGSPSPEPTASTGPTGAIRLNPTDVIGRTVFPIGNTASGGQGQTLLDIPCGLGSETYHIHTHLSLFVNGDQIAIPAGIGFKDPIADANGLVEDGICLYDLHTHDQTGIVHVESAAQRDFTLGMFFALWGRPLSRVRVADFDGPVTVYVDGVLYSGEPSALVFGSLQQITLVVGARPATLPVYVLPYEN